MYKVAIRPILLYGFPIWFTISPIVAKELEVFERKILRKCINKHYLCHDKKYSNSFVYETSGVQPLCIYAFNYQKLFIERLATHENDLLKEIFEYEKLLRWSGSAYISPVGIINENLDIGPETYTLPDFYKKTIPGSNRG